MSTLSNLSCYRTEAGFPRPLPLSCHSPSRCLLLIFRATGETCMVLASAQRKTEAWHQVTMGQAWLSLLPSPWDLLWGVGGGVTSIQTTGAARWTHPKTWVQVLTLSPYPSRVKVYSSSSLFLVQEDLATHLVSYACHHLGRQSSY